MQKSNRKSLRGKIRFYLIDCETIPGKLIDIFIIILNLIICATFVIDTYPIAESTRQLLIKIEIVIVAFFIIEYIARLYGARNKLKHMLDIYSVIDLIAILPVFSFFFPLNIGFIKIIRIFRIFRIFRFLRFAADPHFFFGTITMHLLKVLRLALTILLIFFISSGLFFQVESSINPGVNTFGDAFYYTVVTLTTVGFGDILPISTAGRMVTVIMIISGIIFIPWQASQIIKEWIHKRKKDITCPNCGLRYHDADASHCKSCGHVIYQAYED